MGASFAKAVIPRVRREDEVKQEADWSLGWVFSERAEPSPSSAAEREAPAVVLREAEEPVSAPARPEDASQKIVHD